MKIFIALLLLINIGCNTMGELSPKCEQVLRSDGGTLCPSGECLVTYVWSKGDIVKSWYDDVDNPKIDSIKVVRERQASKLIELLKTLK